MAYNGYWAIDGYDLWANFSIVLQEGSADFLKFPPKKPSTEHDWGDSNGIDVDLSRIFLGKREGVLRMAILVNSEEEFFQKKDAFFAMITKPGLRRFELRSHGSRSYYIYYNQTTAYKQEIGLKGIAEEYKIVHTFSISVIEPEPKFESSNVYLVTEDGKFIIT